MPKRCNPFGECSPLQRKTHVADQQVNEGVCSQIKMRAVYGNGGTRRGGMFVSLFVSRGSDCGRRLWDLICWRDGTPTFSPFCTVAARISLSCETCARLEPSQSHCSRCERRLCMECCRTCGHCSGSVCSYCSIIRDYNNHEGLGFHSIKPTNVL
uniref:Apoptosis regulatory protein Siva n=1 Tax=Eptatretus burgeri TaxID=7764 RepID=A0A8C4WVN3_EPTBU